MTAVTVAVQVFRITGSSFAVGLVGAFALVPLVVFGLYGGAVADVVDRRKLMFWSSLGLALLSAVLFVQATSWLHPGGVRSVWLLYLVVSAQSALFAINNPARVGGDPAAGRARAAAGRERAAAGDVQPRLHRRVRCWPAG